MHAHGPWQGLVENPINSLKTCGWTPERFEEKFSIFNPLGPFSDGLDCPPRLASASGDEVSDGVLEGGLFREEKPRQVSPCQGSRRLRLACGYRYPHIP